MAPRPLAFKYRGTNLGDDIQTLAMMRLMPEGSDPLFIERDKLARSELTGKLVLGGWWGHDAKGSLPVPAGIDALPVSMHLNLRMQMYEGTASLINGTPVGARDLSTLEYLRSKGAKDAYFSGCMTLTMAPSNNERSGVILCDLKPTEDSIARSFFPSAKSVSHHVHHLVPHDARRQMAAALLEQYASAELVITSRLHAALPCVAMGTPVILCYNPMDPRFTGYGDTLPIVYPKDLDAAIRMQMAAPFERHDESFRRSEELRERIIAFLC